MKNSPKKAQALFFIQELKNDGATRADIIRTLVSEMSITAANAAYYVDRVPLPAPVKMVTRINMMSGKPFQIAEGTPVHMDPSRESYWSM